MDMLNKAGNVLGDPLYRNSLYIVLTSIVGAGFGFFFWMIAGRVYSPVEVGIATGLISAMAVIVSLTRLGMDYSIIRFLPEGDKESIYSTILITSTSSCILVGFFFVFFVEYFAPNLSFLKEPVNTVMFTLFLAANSINSVNSSTALACRKGGLLLVQSILNGLRIFLLPPLKFLGYLGVYASLGLANTLTSIISYRLLMKEGLRLHISINKKFISKTLTYSTGNYISSLMSAVPAHIISIMVLNVLGPAETAYYYIDYAIASLLYAVPYSVSTSLFIEGSYGEALRKTVLKSLKAGLIMLLPTAAVLYFFPEHVLTLIGKGYASEGVNLLKLMVLSSIPITVSSIYFSIKRVKKKTSEITALSVVNALLLLTLTAYFMPEHGLDGVGHAWLISNTLPAVYIILKIRRMKWI